MMTEFKRNLESKGDIKFSAPVAAIGNYAIVYLWESWCAICLCCGSCCCPTSKRMGHVSMQLVKSDRARIKNGYISIWPDETRMNRTKFVSSLADDVREMSNEKPSKKFCVRGVNIEAIYEKFQSMEGYRWRMSGSGFFKSAKETNCSGLVAELLLKNGLENSFLKKPRSLYRKCKDNTIGGSDQYPSPPRDYERAEDIIEIISSKGSCKEALKRGVLIIGSLSLIIFWLLSCRSGGSGRPSVSVLGTDHVVADVDPLMCITFMLFIGICFTCGFEAPRRYITNCGGVSPDDVGFLLEYLSKNTDANIQQLESLDAGYNPLREEYGTAIDSSIFDDSAMAISV